VTVQCVIIVRPITQELPQNFSRCNLCNYNPPALETTTKGMHRKGKAFTPSPLSGCGFESRDVATTDFHQTAEFRIQSAGWNICMYLHMYTGMFQAWTAHSIDSTWNNYSRTTNEPQTGFECSLKEHEQRALSKCIVYTSLSFVVPV